MRNRRCARSIRRSMGSMTSRGWPRLPALDKSPPGYPDKFRGGRSLAIKFSRQESDFFLETSNKKPEDWPVHKIVYLSLGSNLGDRSANLLQAIDKLGELGRVAAVSSFYDTEPVELTSQPWFLNCVAKLDTEKMPRQLISAILGIEQEMGRQRKQQKGPRTIDIDILL